MVPPELAKACARLPAMLRSACELLHAVAMDKGATMHALSSLARIVNRKEAELAAANPKRPGPRWLYWTNRKPGAGSLPSQRPGTAEDRDMHTVHRIGTKEIVVGWRYRGTRVRTAMKRRRLAPTPRQGAGPGGRFGAGGAQDGVPRSGSASAARGGMPAGPKRLQNGLQGLCRLPRRTDSAQRVPAAQETSNEAGAQTQLPVRCRQPPFRHGHADLLASFEAAAPTSRA
jgi:hypothetical protein